VPGARFFARRLYPAGAEESRRRRTRSWGRIYLPPAGRFERRLSAGGQRPRGSTQASGKRPTFTRRPRGTAVPKTACASAFFAAGILCREADLGESAQRHNFAA
jgi:hypothetical protein